ncbi:MAG: hypothetical protein AAGA16_21365 [Cyanobacteria bacterium P01_E01_bin.35]
MTDKFSTIEQVANHKINQSKLPDASEVVTSLLELEKCSRKAKTDYSLSDLLGCWSLRFITGTKKTRKRAGIVLGAGKFIPQWLKIQITYESAQQSTPNAGRVKNSVALSFLKLSLSGPVKFVPDKKILAFDFTSLELTVLGVKLYSGYLRRGLEAEANFHDQGLKDQAFFRYFLIKDNLIAARGRGGGLALWSREA